MEISHDISSNKKIRSLTNNLELNSNILKEILPLMYYLSDDTKIEDEKMNNNDIECSNNLNKLSELIQNNNKTINKLQQRKIQKIIFLKNNGESNSSEKIVICVRLEQINLIHIKHFTNII